MAYDRLLQRLYLVDPEWIIKRAAALLARDLGVRATIDIDVYRDLAREAAQSELRAAASADLGDWFRFEIGRTQAVSDGAPSVRLPVRAYVGPTGWASFYVDLVGSELRMTGQPDGVLPLARVGMPDVEQHDCRAYPLVDHVADKIAATFQRYGPGEVPSTRYKDLVDLVAIVTQAPVDADLQRTALASVADRRGIVLPAHFFVPDRALWERGYAAEAGRSLLTMGRTLDEALEIVLPFADPLLEGNATGRWIPVDGRWSD